MKVAIVGSRKYTNLRKVQTYIATLPKDTVVINGKATPPPAASGQAPVSGYEEAAA